MPFKIVLGRPLTHILDLLPSNSRTHKSGSRDSAAAEKRNAIDSDKELALCDAPVCARPINEQRSLIASLAEATLANLRVPQTPEQFVSPPKLSVYSSGFQKLTCEFGDAVFNSFFDYVPHLREKFAHAFPQALAVAQLRSGMLSKTSGSSGRCRRERSEASGRRGIESAWTWQNREFGWAKRAWSNARLGFKVLRLQRQALNTASDVSGFIQAAVNTNGAWAMANAAGSSAPETMLLTRHQHDEEALRVSLQEDKNSGERHQNVSLPSETLTASLHAQRDVLPPLYGIVLQPGVVFDTGRPILSEATPSYTNPTDSLAPGATSKVVASAKLKLLDESRLPHGIYFDYRRDGSFCGVLSASAAARALATAKPERGTISTEDADHAAPSRWREGDICWIRGTPEEMHCKASQYDLETSVQLLTGGECDTIHALDERVQNSFQDGCDVERDSDVGHADVQEDSPRQAFRRRIRGSHKTKQRTTTKSTSARPPTQKTLRPRHISPQSLTAKDPLPPVKAFDHPQPTQSRSPLRAHSADSVRSPETSSAAAESAAGKNMTDGDRLRAESAADSAAHESAAGGACSAGRPAAVPQATPRSQPGHKVESNPPSARTHSDASQPGASASAAMRRRLATGAEMPTPDAAPRSFAAVPEVPPTDDQPHARTYSQDIESSPPQPRGKLGSDVVPGDLRNLDESQLNVPMDLLSNAFPNDDARSTGRRQMPAKQTNMDLMSAMYQDTASAVSGDGAAGAAVSVAKQSSAAGLGAKQSKRGSMKRKSRRGSAKDEVDYRADLLGGSANPTAGNEKTRFEDDPSHGRVPPDAPSQSYRTSQRVYPCFRLVHLDNDNFSAQSIVAELRFGFRVTRDLLEHAAILAQMDEHDAKARAADAFCCASIAGHQPRGQ